jgi:hypothetical protein
LKEQFAINDFRRAYGTNIPHVQSRYDSEPYALEQEVVAWELPEEVIENAGEGPAQVDLRAIETRNAMSRLMNSYEYTVSQAVTVTGSYNPYEPWDGVNGSQTGLGFETWSSFNDSYDTASGPAAWSALSANPIEDVLTLKRAVANQIGIRPNSAVLGTAVFDQLLTNQAILERIKYTSADSIDTDVLARYFGLERGLRVAEGRYLANDGTLQPVFPSNGILLFYSPNGPSDSIMPAGGANSATPAFAYTYQLTGTPSVRPEYYIRERRVVRAEITIERVVNLVGLGATGLIGSGSMITDILS